jgi:hypothetical protein
MVGRGGAAVNAWRPARPVELCGKTLKCGVRATKGPTTLRRQLAAQVRFDLVDLAAHARFGARAIVDLQVHADARAVRLQRFEAGRDHAHHVFPFTFEDGAHGCELVGNAALVNDVENARDVGAEAFTLAMGGHGEFEEDHLPVLR